MTLETETDARDDALDDALEEDLDGLDLRVGREERPTVMRHFDEDFSSSWIDGKRPKRRPNPQPKRWPRTPSSHMLRVKIRLYFQIKTLAKEASTKTG